MDVRSLMVVLGVSKKWEQDDVNTAIRQWLKEDRIPDPYGFTPTMEKPTCSVPGRATAKFNRAYGVVRTGTGFSGAPLQEVRWCAWDWFLDEDAAKREAWCRIWQQTDDGWAWLDRSGLDKVTLDDLKRHDQREIAVPGGAVTLYRVPVQDRMFGTFFHWKVVPEQDQAVALHRECLFQAWAMAVKASFAVPAPTANSGSKDVPEVVAQEFTRCPWTDEPIMGYSSWTRTARGQIVCQWFSTEEEAASARTALFECLRAEEIHRRQKEELAIARELYEGALDRCRVQTVRREYEQFVELLGLQCPERYWQDAPKGSELDEEIEWYLSVADTTDAVANELKQKLDAERERRLAPWKEGALESLRKSLRDAQPTCPLCGREYVTDAVLEDLILYGEAEPHCCSLHGLSADPKRLAEGQSSVPAIIVRLHKWASRVKDCDDRSVKLTLFEPKESFAHYVIEVGHIRLGGEIVLRFLVQWTNMCRWELQIVATDGLLEIMREAGATVCASYQETLTPRERKLEDWWVSRLTALVENGQAVWLRLEKHPQHGWGARRRKSGKMTAFKVSRPDETGYDPSKDYFCRVVSVPEHMKKPDFELWIVQPDLEATE